MSVIRSEKQAVVAELKEKLASAKGAVLVDFRGLTVAQDTVLRRKMREAGVEYRVIKNTLTAIAAKEAGIEGLDTYLVGTTAIAMSSEDPVVAAKIVSEFAKDKEYKNLKIKAGIVEGKMIDADGVKALSSLPPREVLIAQVLAGFQAPIAGLVNVLQGTIRNTVYVLDAIRKQKESA